MLQIDITCEGPELECDCGPVSLGLHFRKTGTLMLPCPLQRGIIMIKLPQWMKFSINFRLHRQGLKIQMLNNDDSNVVLKVKVMVIIIKNK